MTGNTPSGVEAWIVQEVLLAAYLDLAGKLDRVSDFERQRRVNVERQWIEAAESIALAKLAPAEAAAALPLARASLERFFAEVACRSAILGKGPGG